jgi:hypothetical protein
VSCRVLPQIVAPKRQEKGNVVAGGLEIAIPYFHAMTPNEAVALTQFGLRQTRYGSAGLFNRRWPRNSDAVSQMYEWAGPPTPAPPRSPARRRRNMSAGGAKVLWMYQVQPRRRISSLGVNRIGPRAHIRTPGRTPSPTDSAPSYEPALGSAPAKTVSLCS